MAELMSRLLCRKQKQRNKAETLENLRLIPNDPADLVFCEDRLLKFGKSAKA
jgi:hypothetical protein